MLMLFNYFLEILDPHGRLLSLMSLLALKVLDLPLQVCILLLEGYQLRTLICHNPLVFIHYFDVVR